MSKGHKDLPAGSQPWANEVDKGLARIKELEGIIRRLAENAGIDMANPTRGINPGDTPNVGSPVGQKLSSLADVDTYNVLDGQVPAWSQQGQKWLPVDQSGGISWRKPTDEEVMDYELLIDSDGDSGLVIGQENPALTGAGNTVNSYGHVGTGDASAWLHAAGYWLAGPERFHGYFNAQPYYVKLGSMIINDETGDWTQYGEIEVGRGDIFLTTPKYQWDEGDGYIMLQTNWFFVPRFTTAERPIQPDGVVMDGAMIYDTTLNKPIWQSGVNTWRDAMGNVV